MNRDHETPEQAARRRARRMVLHRLAVAAVVAALLGAWAVAVGSDTARGLAENRIGEKVLWKAAIVGAATLTAALVAWGRRR